ncbi:MAG: (deoxy)nucleoside triphosphate pyrophosphohydrolase [Pirellulales bacterium]
MSAIDNEQAPRTDIAVAVVEDEGRFLIGRREEGVPLAGLWEFPGGKVQPHESPEEAAVRECLEETGLLVRVVSRYSEAVHDYEHAAVRLHFFACEKTGARRPLASRFRWVRRAELAQYSFPAANAPLVEWLAAPQAKPGR